MAAARAGWRRRAAAATCCWCGPATRRCGTDEQTYLNAAGVSKSGNIWAADQQVVAVGADNMAWDNMVERDPDTKMALFGHVHLLVKHGIHIIENLNLEELAAAKHPRVRVHRDSAEVPRRDRVADPSARAR